MRQHKVMLGDKVLYQAAQLSHAKRFAQARQAEGVACYVVPDTTAKKPRSVRINSLTGQPYKKSSCWNGAGPHRSATDDSAS
ncbi:hypothetical protein ACLEIY_06140 [Acetobacter tropicalis]|uniref:Uncharacterized protein n=1 Tax=Acetobacter tropicalis NBRC 101654 TaxID=749388 RepID=F7VDN8_9PROT|nr:MULTISPECIES: hypothetical protein [Acetobacter]MCG4253558.1 hypothetical protein [Acetobacter senegalensis]GAA08483.1 hypothetical protein ATPR_1487 [Acetobacter tropicalis NBRC 101654]